MREICSIYKKSIKTVQLSKKSYKISLGLQFWSNPCCSDAMSSWMNGGLDWASGCGQALGLLLLYSCSWPLETSLFAAVMKLHLGGNSGLAFLSYAGLSWRLICVFCAVPFHFLD